MTRRPLDWDIVLGICAAFVVGYTIGYGIFQGLVRLLVWIGGR